MLPDVAILPEIARGTVAALEQDLELLLCHRPDKNEDSGPLDLAAQHFQETSLTLENYVGLLNQVGVDAFKRDDFNSASGFLDKACAFTEKTHAAIWAWRNESVRLNLRAAAFNNLGCMEKRKGDFAKALKYLKMAQRIEETLDIISPSTLTNIAAVLNSLRQSDEAIIYAERAVRQIQKTKLTTLEERHLMAVCWHNLAMAQRHSSHPDRWWETCAEALTCATKFLGLEHPLTKAIQASFHDRMVGTKGWTAAPMTKMPTSTGARFLFSGGGPLPSPPPSAIIPKAPTRRRPQPPSGPRALTTKRTSNTARRSPNPQYQQPTYVGPGGLPYSYYPQPVQQQQQQNLVRPPVRLPALPAGYLGLPFAGNPSAQPATLSQNDPATTSNGPVVPMFASTMGQSGAPMLYHLLGNPPAPPPAMITSTSSTEPNPPIGAQPSQSPTTAMLASHPPYLAPRFAPSPPMVMAPGSAASPVTTTPQLSETVTPKVFVPHPPATLPTPTAPASTVALPSQSPTNPVVSAQPTVNNLASSPQFQQPVSANVTATSPTKVTTQVHAQAPVGPFATARVNIQQPHPSSSSRAQEAGFRQASEDVDKPKSPSIAGAVTATGADSLPPAAVPTDVSAVAVSPSKVLKQQQQPLTTMSLSTELAKSDATVSSPTKRKRKAPKAQPKFCLSGSIRDRREKALQQQKYEESVHAKELERLAKLEQQERERQISFMERNKRAAFSIQNAFHKYVRTVPVEVRRARLEEVRNRRLAACRIQRGVRLWINAPNSVRNLMKRFGFQADNMQALLTQLHVIQRCWRCALSRRKRKRLEFAKKETEQRYLLAERQRMAAVRIQSVVRMYLAGQHAVVIRGILRDRSALIIQRMWFAVRNRFRSKRQKREYLALTIKSAILIQSAFRGYVARVAYRLMRMKAQMAWLRRVDAEVTNAAPADTEAALLASNQPTSLPIEQPLKKTEVRIALGSGQVQKPGPSHEAAPTNGYKRNEEPWDEKLANHDRHRELERQFKLEHLEKQGLERRLQAVHRPWTEYSKLSTKPPTSRFDDALMADAFLHDLHYPHQRYELRRDPMLEWLRPSTQEVLRDYWEHVGVTNQQQDALPQESQPTKPDLKYAEEMRKSTQHRLDRRIDRLSQTNAALTIQSGTKVWFARREVQRLRVAKEAHARSIQKADG